MKTSTSRGMKEAYSRPTLLMKQSLSNQDPPYKVRASSNSLNRKTEDRFLFRPAIQTSINVPTPRDKESNDKSIESSFKFDLPKQKENTIKMAKIGSNLASGIWPKTN